MYSTTKLSKYFTLSTSTFKDIQWIPTDPTRQDLLDILDKLFLE